MFAFGCGVLLVIYWLSRESPTALSRSVRPRLVGSLDQWTAFASIGKDPRFNPDSARHLDQRLIPAEFRPFLAIVNRPRPTSHTQLNCANFRMLEAGEHAGAVCGWL